MRKQKEKYRLGGGAKSDLSVHLTALPSWIRRRLPQNFNGSLNIRIAQRKSLIHRDRVPGYYEKLAFQVENLVINHFEILCRNS